MNSGIKGQTVFLPGVLVVFGVFLSACPAPQGPEAATGHVAREWNELLLEAIRNDVARPTVQARNLFHLSAAMYEAWAAYDEQATGYFTGYRLKQPAAERNLANRAEAISHAAYSVLNHRFGHLATREAGSPGRNAFDAFAAKMRRHGYFDSENMPVPSPAQALGAQIGAIVIAYGLQDGANESGNYADTTGYAPANPPIEALGLGTNGMVFPNLWQPIILPNGATQSFLTPHWGQVKPFALPPYRDDEPRMVQGMPPRFGASEAETAAYIDSYLEVVLYSAGLDPEVGMGAEDIDIAPGAFLNNSLGMNNGVGHALNPFTGQPYNSYIVKRGNWSRTIAEYWADGPGSETPPGHWNVLANNLLTGTGLAKARLLNKTQAEDLAYDVKLYFALNGAVHDAAIATWDIKHYFDHARPISGIRFLAEEGMLPLVDGVVDLIGEGDPLAGEVGEFVGQNKILSWLGPDQGVGWMLGSAWRPYQAANFVTPPFGGYSSGHSCFSRASAEVLTRFSGDPFFPGGASDYAYFKLVFELEPEEEVGLHWATYYDAADEAGLSRLAGGIHIGADDLHGRMLGSVVGKLAYERAMAYFEGRGVAVAKSLLE